MSWIVGPWRQGPTVFVHEPCLNTIAASPISMTSPSDSSCSATILPFTLVPFADPTSKIV